MKAITPFLWFKDNAEEAVSFYETVFKNFKIHRISRYGDEMPEYSGKVMTIDFEINGNQFIALNGGGGFSFSPAVSFFITCDSQEEVDALWDKLSEGGEIMQCGWLTDKYGVTWQVVPAEMDEYIFSADPEMRSRAFTAMMQMKKLDINIIKEAALAEVK